MNPNAIGTMLDTVDEAEDQDGRQLARFRGFQRAARHLREKAHDPDAVLTLANLIEADARDGEQDEQQDVVTHRTWRQLVESLGRKLRRIQPA